MNILIFSWRGPRHPNSGGAEIATHEHAKAWVSAGHQVTLFTSAIPGCLPEEKIDGVTIIHRGNQILLVQIAAFLWYTFSHHEKYDLIIDQFHGIPFFTPFFVREKKLAFIHEVAREVWWTNHLKPPLNFIYGLIGYCVEPLIFLLYRNIQFLTVSDSTRNDLVDWSIPRRNIHVITNGVTTRFVKAVKEKRPTIVYLGAIAQDKGIKDALLAFSQLQAKHPNSQLWVIGKSEPEYQKALDEMITNLGLEQKIKFWGFVDEDKKFELLARGTVLLNPSVREGWGLVNIEANSVGLPVVAYNVPGCRDSIRDQVTGILCPKGDVRCMSESVSNLVSNRELYRGLSTNAIEWSRRFSWPKSASESLNLLTRIFDTK